MIKPLQCLTAVMVLLCPVALHASTTHWQIQPDKSTIEWTALYGGKPIKGSFASFTSEVAFDPDRLEASKAVVRIDTKKILSSDHDAQENLPTSDWLGASRFPEAVFETTSFTHVKDNDYQVEGNLTVRDKTIKLSMPVVIVLSDEKDASPPVRHAHVTGETSLKRAALGVGKGDWSQTDTVADDVTIAITLEAKEVP